MKLLALVLVAFLFMGQQCGSVDVGKIIQQVQEITSKTCSYVPTANTILAILNADKQLQDAAALAAQICKAVQPQAGGLRAERPMVGNVPVEGYRISG